MSKHTPGPWRIVVEDGHKCYISADGDLDVAGVYWQGEETVKNANARLIAAAPDLLEALVALLDSIRQTDDQRLFDDLAPSLHDAEAAVAKAEGRSS